MLTKLQKSVWTPSTLAGSRVSFVRPDAWLSVLVGLLVVGGSLQAEEAYLPQAGEYSLSGPVVGDQVQAAIAVRTGGGILVWEDNSTDGDGSGLSYRVLDSSFSGILSSSRVNASAQGDQGKPDVALLSDGGAVIAWEGGVHGFEDIYVRFLSSTNTWVTGDILVNTHTNEPQEDPAVTALDNGDSVVAWSSYNEAGATSMKDVYLQRFSSAGARLGTTLRVNQNSLLNQRDPAITRLSDGRFVVAWISESQFFVGGTNELYSVDVFARIYSSAGVPEGNEFKVNTFANLAANPTLAASLDGGFLVAWSDKDLSSQSNSWDIACRTFSSGGTGGATSILNSYRYGDQFGPSAATLGADFMVVWTSLAQDGSHEGVFGRFVSANGQPAGGELQVNTTTVSKQLLPDLASDGGTRFLAVWSGFTGLSSGFDVFGQRYATVLDPLYPPDPPYVWPLSSSEIAVTWPELAGFDVTAYEVYADGATSPTAAVSSNRWAMTGLTSSTTHSFRLAYLLDDGRRSPLSGVATTTTYGPVTYGGISYEWGEPYWGTDVFDWPNPYLDSDGDGASNRDEFLAGTDPMDADSVLRTGLTPTPQGMFLNWNTVPGRIYQVQQSPNFTSWTDLGEPRFAPGAVDSLNVGAGGSGLFRVVLIRN